MMLGLDKEDLAGKPVLYKGRWYQPIYGASGIIEFVLIPEEEAAE